MSTYTKASDGVEKLEDSKCLTAAPTCATCVRLHTAFCHGFVTGIEGAGEACGEVASGDCMCSFGHAHDQIYLADIGGKWQDQSSMRCLVKQASNSNSISYRVVYYTPKEFGLGSQPCNIAAFVGTKPVKRLENTSYVMRDPQERHSVS